MSIITALLNGTNLNRDAHVQTPATMLLSPGVRKGFSNELAITTNSCAAGMALVEVTRTTVTPNETFLVLVNITAAETIDTSGTGYVFIQVDSSKIGDGSSNSADGTGIATIEVDSVLPASNFLELASLSSGTITDTRVFSELNDNIFDYHKGFATDSGGTDAYAISVTGVKAYEDGQRFYFEANTANTGNATLNINSLGAKNILKNHSATLDDGDIAANMRVCVIYDADQDAFILTNQVANADSFQICSQAEAEEQPATENTKGVSPLRLQQFFSHRVNPVLVAGENIDGSSTPELVYVSDGSGGRTSGRVYRADDTTVYDDAINPIGFTYDNVTTGQNINVVTTGIISGFSGLTIGANYYLTSTAGTISTTPSSNNVEPIGRAISETQILIKGISKEQLHSFTSIRKKFISPADMYINGTSDLDSGIQSNREYVKIDLQSGSSESVVFNFLKPDGFSGIEKVELVYSASSTRTIDIYTNSGGSGNSMTINSTDSLTSHSLTSAGSNPPFVLYSDITAAYNGLSVDDDDVISTRIVNASGSGIDIVGVIVTFN